MPNICENTLKVEGADSEEFLRRCAGHTARYFVPDSLRKLYGVTGEYQGGEEVKFTFNAIVPVPEEVLERGYSGGGHDWQRKNWGTKWDVMEDPQIARRAGGVVIRLLTAWGPPVGWLKGVSEAFPHLTFSLEYEEEANDLAGRIVFKGGEVVEEV